MSSKPHSHEFMAMKRLLKDGATGLFYDGNGGWTADENAAFAFKDSAEAIRAYQKLLKPNIFLVLKFQDSRFDISTPLGHPEPPTVGKHRKSKTVLISTVLPAAMEAIKVVASRL